MESEKNQIEKKKSFRKTRVGIVIADNTPKTVKVKVEGLVQHPKYKKYIKRSKNYLVHDPLEQCKIGDKVLIEESRPFSKMKKWIVRQVLQKASEKMIEKIKEAENDSSGNSTESC